MMEPYIIPQKRAMTQPFALAPVRIELIPRAGEGVKRTIFLLPSTPVTIGRTSRASTADNGPHDSNAYFDCPVMSRRHAELEAIGRAVKLTDLGSLHGTFVNDMPLVKDVPIELKDGDKIRLGNNVSRGQDFFSGIHLTVKYGAPAESIESATVSHTFAVPTATDDDEDDDEYDDDYAEDEEYDSEYGEDLSDNDILEASSPATSSPSAKDMLGSSPEKPIAIDILNENITDLDMTKHFAAERKRPLLETLSDRKSEHTFTLPAAQSTVFAEQSRKDAQDKSEHIFTLPAAQTSVSAEQSRMDAQNLTPLPDIWVAAIDSVLKDPALAKKSAPGSSEEASAVNRSPSKMAITNMLAPAYEAAPADQPELPKYLHMDPFQHMFETPVLGPPDVADDLLAHSLPEESLQLAAPSKKRKASSLTDDQPQGTVENDTSAIVSDQYYLDQLCAEIISPKKRKRTSRGRSTASHLAHETAKYSFGAAVGAMSTFAFLASPLGGRFADWLSTI